MAQPAADAKVIAALQDLQGYIPTNQPAAARAATRVMGEIQVMDRDNRSPWDRRAAYRAPSVTIRPIPTIVLSSHKPSDTPAVSSQRRKEASILSAPERKRARSPTPFSRFRGGRGGSRGSRGGRGGIVRLAGRERPKKVIKGMSAADEARQELLKMTMDQESKGGEDNVLPADSKAVREANHLSKQVALSMVMHELCAGDEAPFGVDHFVAGFPCERFRVLDVCSGHAIDALKIRSALEDCFRDHITARTTNAAPLVQYVGFDISERAVERGNYYLQNDRREDMHEGSCVSHADVNDVLTWPMLQPFDDADDKDTRFHLINFQMSVHYVHPDKFKTVMSHIADMLHPNGGILLISAVDEHFLELALHLALLHQMDEPEGEATPFLWTSRMHSTFLDMVRENKALIKTVPKTPLEYIEASNELMMGSGKVQAQRRASLRPLADGESTDDVLCAIRFDRDSAGQLSEYDFKLRGIFPDWSREWVVFKRELEEALCRPEPESSTVGLGEIVALETASGRFSDLYNKNLKGLPMPILQTSRAAKAHLGNMLENQDLSFAQQCVSVHSMYRMFAFQRKKVY